jgi:ribosomal protein S12 methylthiotransferase
VEGPCDESDDLLEGRLKSQAPEIDGRLLINDAGGRDVKAGEIVQVRITETYDYDVVGEIV